MTVFVHLGKQSIDMGSESLPAYVNDDSPESMDISFVNVLAGFASDPNFISEDYDGDELVMRSGAYDLVIRGEFAAPTDDDPVTFASFALGSFELKDNTDLDGNSRIFQMSFSSDLDVGSLINQVFADPGNADMLADDFAALLAGHGVYFSNLGRGSDGFNGTNQGDTLVGNDGNDTLSGLGGDDGLYGGRGADRVDGGAGADTIFGGASDDWISGGAGRDGLSGGTGADTFYFRLPLGSGNVDTIHDFSRAGGDELLFDSMPLVIGAAVETSEFRSGRNISVSGGAQTSDQRFLYDNDSGRLFYDADGSATGFKPVLVVTLVGAPVLTASDISIVY